MTQQKTDNTIYLNVQRGVGNGPSHTVRYEIPVGPAASVLDGLRWVRENVDDSLAFRYSCINANACKECMMIVDDKVVYACMERLQPGVEHHVSALPNKARIRDLISQIAPVKERLQTGDEGDEDGA